MAEVKVEPTELWQDTQSSGVKPSHIKEELEFPDIKEEPEPRPLKEEPEEFSFPTVTVKPEDDKDESSVLHQRPTKENREETNGSSSDTDHSEDYSQEPVVSKRSYAMIPSDSCVTDHRPFSCSECGKGFKSNAHLKRHMSVHTGEKPHKCSGCERTFKEKATLTKHLIHFHLLCPVCEKHFSDKIKLNSHLRTHVEEGTLDSSFLKASSCSEPRPFSCPECGKRCKYQSDLKIHMLIHTGEKPHKCSVCEKTWRYKQELRQHLRKQHGLTLSKDNASLIKIPESEADRKPVSCSYCGKRFRWKSDLQRHTSVHTGERPFSCSFCGKGFNRKPHLTDHRQSVHHVCTVCETRFPDQTKLNEHLPTHVEEGALKDNETSPFSCSECGREFKFKSELKRHMTFHTGEKPCRCSVCDRGFSLSSDLKMHMRTHTGERPFSCSDCGKSFTGNNKLTRHQRVVHHFCPVCKSGFTSRTKLQEHLRTHEEEGARSARTPFSCPDCGKECRSEVDLRRHVQHHTGQRPHACSICQRSFQHKSTLVIHKRTHTGEKPFRCSLCQKDFSQQAHLKKHLRAFHHQCPVCKTSFTNDTELKIHQSSHSNGAVDLATLTPYSCSDCTQAFSCKVDLQKHTILHTGDRPHKCRYCEKSFQTKWNLVQHLQTHTGEKPYSCSICEKTTGDPGNLRRHIRSHHPSCLQEQGDA